MNQAKRTRLLLADDHELVRHGMATFLAAQPEFEVVGEASDGREALELAGRLRPDIVLMDISMAGLGGVEATRRIREKHPGIRVIALSMHKDPVYVREALRAGADGYLLKEARSADLLAAIRAVRRGEAYISPAVSPALLDDYRRQAKAPIDLLTARERDVLQLVAEGLTNKEIARKLELSVYTAEGYRARIMEKLNLHSTGELVRFAMRSGLID